LKDPTINTNCATNVSLISKETTMNPSLTVNELMDKQFLTFPAEMPVLEAVEILRTRKLFGACVVDQANKVLGILSEKACIRLYEDSWNGNLDRPLREIKVTEIMYPEFKIVPKTLGVVQAAELFLKSEFRRLPVVESGRLIGQITRRDIVKAVRELG
jgi:CBS domain-containing protein